MHVSRSTREDIGLQGGPKVSTLPNYHEIMLKPVNEAGFLRV